MFQTRICVRFVLIFLCVLVCPRPPKRLLFSQRIILVLTPLLPSHNLFRFLGIVWRVSAFPTLLGSGGHSFRRGGATWAFQNSVPGEFIQIYGGWASDAYKSYLEFSDDAKLRVAQDMVRALPGVLDNKSLHTLGATASYFVWRG